MVVGHQGIKKKILGCLHRRSFRERGCFAPNVFSITIKIQIGSASPCESPSPDLSLPDAAELRQIGSGKGLTDSVTEIVAKLF
jgi:hypothetical protein